MTWWQLMYSFLGTEVNLLNCILKIIQQSQLFTFPPSLKRKLISAWACSIGSHMNISRNVLKTRTFQGLCQFLNSSWSVYVLFCKWRQNLSSFLKCSNFVHGIFEEYFKNLSSSWSFLYMFINHFKNNSETDQVFGIFLHCL